MHIRLLMPSIGLGIIATLVLGCSNSKPETPPAPEYSPTAAAAMAPAATPARSVTFAMHAQNGSGETGSATLTPLGARTRVVIGLKGENTTGDQPAHIHIGPCAKLDPKPKYPLKNVILGKSNTVVDVPIDQLTAGNMAVNVHESAKHISKYVSCGDIRS